MTKERGRLVLAASAAAAAAEVAAGVAAAAEVAARVAAAADAAHANAEEDAEDEDEAEAEPDNNLPFPSPVPSIQSQNSRTEHNQNSPLVNEAHLSPLADSPHTPNSPQFPDDDYDMYQFLSASPAARNQAPEDDYDIPDFEDLSSFARLENDSPPPVPGTPDQDHDMLDLGSNPPPLFRRPAKRDFVPDESPLLLKRLRISERPP